MTYEEITKELFPDKYNQKIKNWLNRRYGEAEGNRIFEKTKDNYLSYYKDLPDYGGKNNGHAAAIYGGLLVFALYEALEDKPPMEELQELTKDVFMEPFRKLGKIFDLNRRSNMWLIDKVFNRVGKRDREDLKKYPEGFDNTNLPYDSKNQISRYVFNRCPNAEFAKKHNLLHVLPLCCNCDFYGIEQIHGTLIREGTCGNSDHCDYCVVGNNNPLAKQYEIVKDENGFLVSRYKEI